MLAFCQWALGAGFWRFIGVAILLVIALRGIAEIVNALARIVHAFRVTVHAPPE